MTSPRAFLALETKPNSAVTAAGWRYRCWTVTWGMSPASEVPLAGLLIFAPNKAQERTRQRKSVQSPSRDRCHAPSASNDGLWENMDASSPAAQFEQTVLLLQGGGALGSYQAGVYQALAEANMHPDWVAGISIGAVNSALIAGNPPEKRVERLREFWESVSTSPLGLPYFPSLVIPDDSTHSLLNQTRALGILLFGAPYFFTPRLPPPMPWEFSRANAVSFYDVSPLKATLERLVDFDRINAGGTRLSVGAVNVRTGNFVYFDTTTHRITPAHIIASGSLPPGFPATEIDGEYFWDGGV